MSKQNLTQVCAWVLALGLSAMPVSGLAGETHALKRNVGDSSVAPAISLLGPGSPPAPRASTIFGPKVGDSGAQIDQCVQAAMAGGDTPGVAVAVVVDGEVFYQQGYGVKKRGLDDPVTPQTVFRIGSVTKMMTAAAVMQQVDAGRVSLDDPVTRLIPDFEIASPWRGDQITIHHLLTHTSGFPDRFFFIDGETGDEALSDWVENQGTASLHAAPGAFWNYSNPNFMIAGLVAERAGGIPYQRYMADNLWAPAGMTSTTFDPAAVMASGDWSWGHYTDPGSGYEFMYEPDAYDNAAAAPAGYAFSTAGDLVQWAVLLMEGGHGLISPESAASMQAHHVSLDYFPDQFYGLGVFSETFNGVEVKQHGGNIPGWGTFLLWVPERRFAVAVLANTFESLPGAAYCIADTVLDLEDLAPVDDTTDPSTWGAFAGHYDIVDVAGRLWTAEVSWSGSGLDLSLIPMWSPEDTIFSPLNQISSRAFVADLDGDEISDTDFTFIGNGGAPDPVIWLRNRQMVGRIAKPPRDGGDRTGP
ncbi:MAG: serine hydrolase domain-containing protein [Acidobacteriota bacterium]